MTTGSRKIFWRVFDAVLLVLQIMGFIGWLSFIVQGFMTRNFSWGWTCATAGFVGFAVNMVRSGRVVRKQ